MYKDFKINVEEHFVDRMRAIIIDSYLSVRKLINSKKRKNCFELFGYDFLIDEDFRLWLIEINTNPYLGLPNAFIKKLVPQMINDMLAIVIDPYFPPSQEFIEQQQQQQNLFILLHSDVINKAGIVKKWPKSFLYPIEQCAQPQNNQRVVQQPQSTEAAPVAQQQQQQSEANLFLQLKHCFDTYPFSDFDPFYGLVNRMFNKLNNWESLSVEIVDIACQCLRFIADTRLLPVLIEPLAFQNLQKFLTKYENYPFKILNTTLYSFTKLFKQTSLKKKLKISELLQTVGKLLYFTTFLPVRQQFTQQNNSDPSLSLQFTQTQCQCVKCICNLAGIFSETSVYVPGETRDNEKIREWVIQEGGVLMLLVVVSFDQTLMGENESGVNEFLKFAMRGRDWSFLKKNSFVSLIEIIKTFFLRKSNRIIKKA